MELLIQHCLVMNTVKGIRSVKSEMPFSVMLHAGELRSRYIS